MSEEYKEPLNILEQKKAFERLLADPAWRILSMEIQQQVDGLQREILFGVVASEADLYKMERLKGCLEGRLSIGNMIQTKIEQLQYDHARAQEAKNADE